MSTATPTLPVAGMLSGQASHADAHPSHDPLDFALARTPEELKACLRANIFREQNHCFGIGDGPWVERATQNWFDDTVNYDNRWRVIAARRPAVGRVLDMAGGCGTFLLHGLNRGRDVVAVEPEAWKRAYFRRKVELSGYPSSYLGRLVASVGESLPFADQTFDLVTTFQTLEHVADVEACLREMLRVLRPGGVLYLRAPDYNCFFEPHYRLPFLPRMNRALAERYLRLLGRPVSGLRTLNWTTGRAVVRTLRRLPHPLRIEQNRHFFIEKRRREIESGLSAPLRRLGWARVSNEAHQLKRRLAAWSKVGRQERVIDLWVTKES